MKLDPGTIVTPDSAPGKEAIVGVVLESKELEVGQMYHYVAWLSEQRGAFLCWEWDTDVHVARLADRAETTDTLIDHAKLASVLADENLITDRA
jgi:hypothetical protein